MMPPTAACSSRTFTSFDSSSVSSVLEHIHRALHVRLQNDAQFLDRALLNRVVQILQRHLAPLGDLALAIRHLAIVRDVPGFIRIIQRVELVARARHRIQADDLHRRRRARASQSACPCRP